MLPSRRAFLASLATLLAPPTFAAERPSLAPDMQRIMDRGKLVVAITAADVPPFVVTGADGKLAGHDIALAEGMARALGVPVAFDRSAGSADAVIDVVARHGADVGLSRLSETLDRAKRVRFSRPYLTLHRALLLNRPRFARLAQGRDPVEVMRGLEAAIAVVDSSDREAAQRLLPEARLRDYPRWEPDAVDAVLKGTVAAALGDELMVRRALAAQPEAPLLLRSVILPETHDPIGVALPWDSLQLLAWVDLYLETAATPLDLDALLAIQGGRRRAPK